MNKQIQQNIQIAKEYADSYDEQGSTIWLQLYSERLAELMIEDCLSCAISCKTQNEDYAAAMSDVREAIKKLFWS